MEEYCTFPAGSDTLNNHNDSGIRHFPATVRETFQCHERLLLLRIVNTQLVLTLGDLVAVAMDCDMRSFLPLREQIDRECRRCQHTTTVVTRHSRGKDGHDLPKLETVFELRVAQFNLSP